MKIISLTAVTVLVLLLCLIAIARPSPPMNAAASASTTTMTELFNKNCAKCHGKDGRAKGFKAKLVGARNLTDGQWQDSVTDERLFNSINNGKGKMPAYGKKLSEPQIDSLVQFVRSLKR